MATDEGPTRARREWNSAANGANQMFELCGRERPFRDAALDGDHGADEADGGQSGNRLHHAKNVREFTEVLRFSGSKTVPFRSRNTPR
jgi:hypothetical protein